MCLLYRALPLFLFLPTTPADAVQIGSVVIVLHAPSDPDVQTVDEILDYAARLRGSNV